MKHLTDFRKTVETGVDPRLRMLSKIWSRPSSKFSTNRFQFKRTHGERKKRYFKITKMHSFNVL